MDNPNSPHQNDDEFNLFVKNPGISLHTVQTGDTPHSKHSAFHCIGLNVFINSGLCLRLAYLYIISLYMYKFVFCII